MLAALAEATGADSGAARAIGHSWGRKTAERTASASCLGLLAQELDRLGFEPAADADATVDGSTRIDFLHCPFRELAEAYPELVCNLHRGICEGLAESRRGTVGTFSALYEPDPCHVFVALP